MSARDLYFNLRVKNAREELLARRTAFVSDLSGHAIEKVEAQEIRITFDDGAASDEIDAFAEEGAELGRKGQQVARRARGPKMTQ